MRYRKFGSIDNAQKVFYGMPEKRIELWNLMISVYIGNNHADKTLYVYAQMKLSSMLPDSLG